MSRPAPTRRAGRRRPQAPGGRVARWVRPLVLAAAAVASIAALAVYVFPTRTWLDQRASLAATSAQLEELRAERDALEQRVAELDSDEHIETIARSQYGLVMPGEEAYAVLPAPARPVELPAIWPFGEPLDGPPTPAGAPTDGAAGRD